MVSRIIPTLWGVRVQQFVPWVMEMTSAGRAATCSAEAISPRAAPAYPMFTTSSPSERAATAGQARAGPLATQLLEDRVAVGHPAGPAGAGVTSPPTPVTDRTVGRMPSGR